MEGFSQEEIARIIKRPVGTVKARISRGRGYLKKMLKTPPGDTYPSRMKLRSMKERNFDDWERVRAPGLRSWRASTQAPPPCELTGCFRRGDGHPSGDLRPHERPRPEEAGGTDRRRSVQVMETMDYSAEVHNTSYDPQTIYILEQVSEVSPQEITY
jgi:hypothetical protein